MQLAGLLSSGHLGGRLGGGVGFAPEACQPWSRAHSHPGSKMFHRPQRPMPRRALLLPEAPAPRLPVAPGRAQHSQLRLNLRSGPLPRSALGGITLLISLVWGLRAPKPLEVNAAGLAFGIGCQWTQCSCRNENEEEKDPQAGVFNWHCPPGPAPACRPSRGSVWGGRAQAASGGAFHGLRLI